MSPIVEALVCYHCNLGQHTVPTWWSATQHCWPQQTSSFAPFILTAKRGYTYDCSTIENVAVEI